MPREIPAIRIFPMSSKLKGFETRGIEDVQMRLFLRDLPACDGKYHYRSSGLNADPHTIVLFQYRARIIASAVFLFDEKFDHPRRGHSGMIHLEPASIRTFDPLDAPAMRKVWPTFRAFGHVKQFLNPMLYSAFKKRLKNINRP